LGGLHYFYNKYKLKHDEQQFNTFLAVGFFSMVLILLLMLGLSDNAINGFSQNHHVSPYLIFFICIFLLLFLIFDLYKFKQIQQINSEKISLFVVLLAYFAISYGCGTSGGLAEGQATLGIGLLICIFLHYTEFYYGWIPRIIIIAVCIFCSFQSINRKMMRTYFWWGVSESNYWKSTEFTHVPLLHGIKVSAETKNIYDGIYDAVQLYCSPEDKIFCFPQIPIFYTLCNRREPDLFNKVQWFDVVAEDKLSQDTQIIENTLPKIIIMYDVEECVYKEHEKSFREGKISATRRMKNSLLELVKSDYDLKKVFVANYNVIYLYVRENKIR
jgi:hypothetical protein